MVEQTYSHKKIADIVTTRTTLRTRFYDPESDEIVEREWKLLQLKDDVETGMVYSNNCVDLVVNPIADNIADKIQYTYKEIEPFIPDCAENIETLEKDDEEDDLSWLPVIPVVSIYEEEYT